MARPAGATPRPSRDHVRFHLATIATHWMRCDHLMDIRGIGQRGRYERMRAELEYLGEAQRYAVAILTLLISAIEDPSA